MQWGCELPSTDQSHSMAHFDADTINAENHDLTTEPHRNERMDVGPSHLENRINCPIPTAAVVHDACAQSNSMVGQMHGMNGPFLKPRKPLGFKCDECGRVFSKKSNMKKHREIHTDELPNFECWLCHKL